MYIPYLIRLVQSSRIQSFYFEPQPVANKQRRPFRIALHAEGKIIFVDTANVFAIEARGNEIEVLERSGMYTLRESIAKLYPKLRSHGFMQIHRRVLVNGAFVREIRRHSSGDYLLRLEDGKEYTVGRAYKKKLDSMVESWAGAAV